ncbi:MAG TPA: DUF4105 domain-containing protein [Oleiagrimonas sp.]|nr:DUF4105 domain-containing protein [Oleiagrimonas sp.]
MPRAHAGIVNAPGANLEISLVTYGPGAIYWERFGHDAIEIRDRVSGQAVTFNYGVFDFSQKDFLLNFARGIMRYSIDAEPARAEINYYKRAGRFVHRQRLAFTPEQADALRDYLLWNLQPGNRLYRYDYYIRNCATRVRDALDQALGGAIKAQLQQPSDGITYRRETDRLMAAQPWLMLVLDLGLSGYADQPLSRWQASFIPMQFMRGIRRIQVADGNGGSKPLVVSDQQVAAARLPAPPAEPPNLIPPLLIAGLIIGLLLAVCGHYRQANKAARIGFASLGTLWLLFAGIAGIGMAVLWAFTAHHSAWANENLLLFNPLALALIASVWRRTPSRMARSLVLLLLAAAVFALLAKVLPGFVQRNLPWICFGLPPWLALTHALHRRPSPGKNG